MRWKIFIFIVLLSLITGCKNNTNDNFIQYPGNGATTPKEAIESLAQSMYEADAKNMLGCFAGTPDELEAIESLANFGSSALQFKIKFIETYGEKEWQDFQDPAKGLDRYDATLDIITDTDLEEFMSLQIRVKEDKAFFTVPDQFYESVILKKNGRWFIQASSIFKPGTNPKAFADAMNNGAKTIKKFEKAIGYEGLTPEDIDEELGRAIWKEMFGVDFDRKFQRTPRFEIDKIK